MTIITLELPKLDGKLNLYPKIAGSLLWLSILCVSYSSIVIKVRCGAQPQHHGAASRERKLTMTLLIVTVASLLLFLPALIFSIVLYDGQFEMSFSVYGNIYGAHWVLLYANSLVNPILYVVRIPQYRSAVAGLFCKRSTLRNRERAVADLPLREL